MEQQNKGKRVQKPRVKARHLIIKGCIEDARKKIIYADLELSFIREMKKSDPNFEHMEHTEKEFQTMYNFQMKRLEFYKYLRDKEVLPPAEVIENACEEIKSSTLESISVEFKK